LAKKSKKAQFYIIGAVIIIFIVISLASVSNYVSIKKQPEKIISLGDMLKEEGQRIVENSDYNDGNVNENINTYLTLFSDYLQQNTQEDFNLLILYGDVSASEDIQGRIFTRASLGQVNLDVGGTSFGASGGSAVQINTPVIVVNPGPQNNQGTVDVTIGSGDTNVTTTVPILEDNNFVFVMTTSDGFNRYVRDNFPRAQSS